MTQGINAPANFHQVNFDTKPAQSSSPRLVMGKVVAPERFTTFRSKLKFVGMHIAQQTVGGVIAGAVAGAIVGAITGIPIAGVGAGIGAGIGAGGGAAVGALYGVIAGTIKGVYGIYSTNKKANAAANASLPTQTHALQKNVVFSNNKLRTDEKIELAADAVGIAAVVADLMPAPLPSQVIPNPMEVVDNLHDAASAAKATGSIAKEVGKGLFNFFFN